MSPEADGDRIATVPPVFEAPTTGATPVVAVVNTWYTVLDQLNTRVIVIGYRITVANETIELETTVDGVTEVMAFAALANTNYMIINEASPLIATQLSTTTRAVDRGIVFLFEGRDVRIRIRKTTNLGGGTLTCKVSRARWP